MIDDVSMFDDDMPQPSHEPPLLDDLDRLAMSNEDVATLTRSEREKRVNQLHLESHALLDAAIARECTDKGKTVAGVVGLFSGGNDSTVLCHIMLDKLTHLGHANTTIGVEETREFVRATASQWGVPLLEYAPPRESDHYESLVLAHGFPGPGHHYKMFQRLKERGINEIRRQLVTYGHRQRVFFLAGRRRTESKRRASVPEFERIGSAVWVSPMVNWTKLDLNTYRLMAGDVPVNRVTDLIHMSGECLCGSFAHSGELDEISEWFPDVVEEIRRLEAAIADRPDIPEQRKAWGWGADAKDVKPSRSGLMCSSCDARYQQLEFA